MSSAPLTIICLPDLQLLESPEPAEVETELNRAVIAAGLEGLSQLKQGLERVVVSPYPLSFQVATLFLPISQVMTDSEALSSAPVPAVKEVSQWVQSTGSIENWFELPEHQPLDYAVRVGESQGVVAVVPLSFYQRYAGSASSLAHSFVEYGKDRVPKPVFHVSQAKQAVSPVIPSKPAVPTPSRHDLDVQLARVEVAVVQEIHSLAVPQHQQRAHTLQTALQTSVSQALTGHYTAVSELKTPPAPYSDDNTKEMALELTKAMECIIGLHAKAKNLAQKLKERGYS